jgi:hypothetical protein
MAKYTIEYTCGHEGHREVQLFGPHKERERKLEWMAQECLCPECWKAKKEAEQKALGIVARVRACPGVKPAILIELYGDTASIKEAAKERGYKWGDLAAGANIVFAVVGMEHGKKGWALAIPVASVEEAARKVADEAAWIKSLPGFNAEKSSWLSPVDAEFLRLGIQKQDEQKAAIAEAARQAEEKKAADAAWLEANPRPSVRGLRQIVGAPRNAKWNRKWYGRDERRVYLDGEEYILTKEQKAEYEASVTAVAAWREKAKAAGVAL